MAQRHRKTPGQTPGQTSGQTSGKTVGSSRAAVREERKRLKLVETALGAIGIGIALLVVPAMLDNSILKGLGAALKMPAFLAIGAGIILLALSRLRRPVDEPNFSESGGNRAAMTGRQRGRMDSKSHARRQTGTETNAETSAESGAYVPEQEGGLCRQGIASGTACRHAAIDLCEDAAGARGG
jgi:hypothetical protein